MWSSLKRVSRITILDGYFVPIDVTVSGKEVKVSLLDLNYRTNHTIIEKGIFCRVEGKIIVHVL